MIVAYCCGKEVLNPSQDTNAKYLVFLPLVTMDQNWQLEGRLARRWEHSPDYRDWTYHLRTDVRWHDGVPVTAHDVKFTVDLLRDVDVMNPGTARVIEAIRVLDDSTVSIRYAGNRGDYDSWAVYYPKHLLEHLDPQQFYNWEFWTRPVGNGPYRFIRYVPQTMMAFEANPDYYRGKPRVEQVVLKFAGETGLTELLSGGVDAITLSNPVQLPALSADPRFRVYQQHSLRVVRLIYWRSNHPLFRDRNVRRALTLAINRRELLQVLNLSRTTPLIDGPVTARQLLRGELPEPWPHDPSRARALLDAAGWRDANGDGVREQDQMQFRFTAIVDSRLGLREMAVYVRDQLRRVGVHMDVQPLELGAVSARLRTGEFEAVFGLAPFAGPNWLAQFFGEKSPLGYRNLEVVGLIDRARAAADPDTLDQIYRELNRIFRVDLPATILFPNVETSIAHRRVQGLAGHYLADPVWYMEDLWLEDESAQQ